MSGLDIPATIDAESVTEWSDEVDVVVIGFGIGGGCAPVTAAAAGARVLVLERAAVAGGTTALAGGHLWEFQVPTLSVSGCRTTANSVLACMPGYMR